MHDGSLATLADVVEFYDRGGIPNPTLDPLMAPLSLSAQERQDLVHYLEASPGTATTLVADAFAAPVGIRRRTRNTHLARLTSSGALDVRRIAGRKEAGHAAGRALVSGIDIAQGGLQNCAFPSLPNLCRLNVPEP